MALKECELKNDGLLETFYEILGEKLNQNREYGFYLFYGCYDVPRKGNDKTEQWESEEVYPFLTGVFAPVSGDYEMGEPQFGFYFRHFRTGVEIPEQLHGMRRMQTDHMRNSYSCCN